MKLADLPSVKPMIEEDPFEANSQMDLPYLSPSSISCYLRCPEQFRREYVLRERRAPGSVGCCGVGVPRSSPRGARTLHGDRRADGGTGGRGRLRQRVGQGDQRGGQLARRQPRTLRAAVNP